MIALTTAFLTAAIALLGKMAFDSWAKYRERQGIAASLAGEIQMYLHCVGSPEVVANLRTFAAADRENRRFGLLSFGRPPSTHPVFDRVADKVGLISIDIAFELSRIYNVVTGVRLILSDFSSERFLSLKDEQQINTINMIISAIETYLVPAQTLVGKLKRVAHQSFKCYLFDCGDTSV